MTVNYQLQPPLEKRSSPVRAGGVRGGGIEGLHPAICLFLPVTKRAQRLLLTFSQPPVELMV